MASLTPTQRTIRELKKNGVVCGVVERWLSYARRPGQVPGPRGVRQDFLGIIDIIALDPGQGVIGIQACGSSFAAHWRKLTEENAQASAYWLETPGTILQVWAWRKVKKKRGGKAMVWKPRIEPVTLQDLMDRN